MKKFEDLVCYGDIMRDELFELNFSLEMDLGQEELDYQRSLIKPNYSDYQQREDRIKRFWLNHKKNEIIYIDPYYGKLYK